MKVLRLLPLVLSTLLLAAHFLRSGNVAAVVLVLAAPIVLVLRERWAVVAVQLFLAVAAAEWVRTALSIAADRRAAGAPSTRMFVILGAVALFTAVSALPLRRLRNS